MSLPLAQTILDGADVRSEVRARADYIVVGSGPGGATVARQLARAGASVVVVEEGPRVDGLVGRDAFRAMASLYRGLGATVALGASPLPLVQGRAVGGTSVVNGAISWRLPRDVYDEWVTADPALGESIPWEDLETATDEVERDLGILPTAADVAGEHNDLLARGAQALGLDHRPIARNTRGCRGLGRCLQGCPDGNKQSMDRSYLPQAIAHGASVMSATRVDRITVDRGRAAGIRGRTRGGAPVALEAEAGVVLCAGAIQSPWLLLKSGLQDGVTGRGLMCHPGVSVSGSFPGEVNMWSGATQGHEVIGLRGEGLKFEALGYDLALVAMRLKQSGRALAEEIMNMNHVAQWGCAIRARARGRVRRAPWGPLVRYDLDVGDMRMARRGVRVLCDLMLAAGAQVVHPGIHGAPHTVRTHDEAARIEFEAPLDPRAYTMAATHLFGTCRMGSDPRTSVVNTCFAHHGVGALHVVDASVFPSNTGVNPQTSIVALATLAGRELSKRG